MSLLLDALHKSDGNRRPADPAPRRLIGSALELEPQSQPAPPHDPASPAIEHAPIPPAGRSARPPLPDWQLVTLFAGIGALITSLWLLLPPTSLEISPAHAAHLPSFLVDDSTVEEEPWPTTVPADETTPPPRAPTPPRAVSTPQQQPPRQATPASSIDNPRFRPTPPTLAASPSALTLAHDAYTAGNLTHAEALYRQALAADPNSVDALIGLGAIALIQNRTAEADTLFHRALQARPLDPTALAGLARISSSDQAPVESRLRDAIAALPENPDSLAPRLALGGLLARRHRWAEAQQIYFDAHRLAPQDADIAYNLAVTLDHLGQYRLAASHYRKALNLAARQPAAATRFSRTRCVERLAILPQLEPAP